MSMVTLHNCLRNARCHFSMVDKILVVEKSKGKQRMIGELVTKLKTSSGYEWYLTFDRFIYTGGKKDKIFKIVPKYLLSLSDNELLEFYTAVIKQWGTWVYREMFEEIKPNLSPEMTIKLRESLFLDKPKRIITTQEFEEELKKYS